MGLIDNSCTKTSVIFGRIRQTKTEDFNTPASTQRYLPISKGVIAFHSWVPEIGAFVMTEWTVRLFYCSFNDDTFYRLIVSRTIVTLDQSPKLLVLMHNQWRA